MTIDAAAVSGALGRLRSPIAGVARRLAGLRGWRRAVAAMSFGALATLALPPAYVVPVLLIAFPALLWLLDGARSSAAAALVGWCFGFGYFVVGLYWIAFALTVDLASYFWLMPFAVAGLPAVLGVFTGAATLVLHRLPVSGVGRVLAFAVLWAAAEWLRGHLFTGFPWNLTGYAWVAWTPVLQSVAVFGIYGLSLLTVAVAALPAAAIAPNGGWSKRGLAALACGVAVFAVLAVGGGVRLAGADHGTVPEVMLRLVQPNIAQADKWNRDRLADNFALHIALSSQPGAQPVTHVVWPESAVPFVLENNEEVLRAIAAAVPPGGLIITGAPRAAPPDQPRQYWNSLLAIDEDGAVVARYDKFHLVPFGEYVPFRNILPIDKVTPGRIDFSPGPGPRTVIMPGLPPVSPLICYEVIFPGSVSADPQSGDPRPALLMNLTNDAWYGLTAGPYQHFAIARTRAVEEGLPMVRVATTGISGVVDAHGVVTARLGLGSSGVVDAALPTALSSPTPYARWGDGPFGLMLLLLAIAAGAGGRRA
ncbi:MAG: apolipoprotein N-acyltransferase [Alphaproteobacteria bacterium]